MHEDTGQIVEEKDIPKKDRKKYVPVLLGALGALSSMTPDERLNQLRLERRGEARERYFETANGPADRKSKRVKKRKAQKLARRKNRK